MHCSNIILYRNKSVENLLISSHEVLSSINSSTLGNVITSKSGTDYSTNDTNESTSKNDIERVNRQPSPSSSPHPSPKSHNKRDYWKTNPASSNSSIRDGDNWSKADERSLVNYF